MCRRLLFTVVFCSFFVNILSLRCYAGTDRECTLAPDMNDCGRGQTCQCTKYRFQCTQADHACNDQEKLNNVTKWAYTLVSTETCQYMKTQPSLYEEITCCSTNGCNRPDSGKCSWSQERRRSLRKLTDLFDF